MVDTLRHIDAAAFHFINEAIANPVLDVLCPVLRGKAFLALFYVAAGLRLLQLYPKQFIRIVAAGALTFLLTDQISAHVIKHFIHRIRPCNNPEIGARLLLDACGSGFSFVSAHAANSFGMAVFLILVTMRTTKAQGPEAETLQGHRRTKLILITWASLVSFSQVYVGVHFPADVIGGAMVGSLIGAGMALLARKYVVKNI